MKTPSKGTVKCLSCKKRFKKKHGSKGKFCCKSCAATYNNKLFPKRKRKARPCAFCGELTSNPKYCSHKCSSEGLKRDKRVHKCKCKYCGEVFYYHRYQKYCNSECESLNKQLKREQKYQKILKSIKNRPSTRRVCKTTRRVLKDLQNNACNCCKRKRWNGQKIPLDLHHKDGNSKNNRFKNLEYLCPNCHAQTDNYKSKNKGRGRGTIKKVKRGQHD